MSEEEILYKCRVNGATKHYLNVLSDLNCCAVSHIEHLLKSNGWVKQGTKFIPPKMKFDPNHIPVKHFEPGSFKGSMLSDSVYGNIEEEVQLRKKTSAPGKLEQAVILYVKENYATGISFLDVAEHFECPLWLVLDIVYKNDVINGAILEHSSKIDDSYIYNAIIANLHKRILS